MKALLLLGILLLPLDERVAGFPLNQSLEDEEPIVLTVDDIQRLGEEKLDDATRGYIGGGAGRKQTLRENTKAFTRFRFQPRVLVDVSHVETATTVLGTEITFPVGLAPSAAHKLANAVGEAGTAQAAEAAGTLMILSAMSSMTIEEVRLSAPNLTLWQQIYLFRNRTMTEAFVKRAAIEGYKAIVVTVDSPVAGQGRNLRRTGVRLPEGVTFANLDASFPGHCFTFDPSSEDYIGGYMSASVTWDDIKWLKEISDLPIVAKGVLTPQAATEAVNHGVAAVIVSNHGGRILDGAPATIDVLPAIMQAVGNRTEVYLDGGVRTGEDAVKALSLGARAVFVGRPVLWGLAYKGKEGVAKVLEILKEELVRTMQLLGCAKSQDLQESFVVRGAYHSGPLPISPRITRKPKTFS